MTLIPNVETIHQFDPLVLASIKELDIDPEQFEAILAKAGIRPNEIESIIDISSMDSYPLDGRTIFPGSIVCRLKENCENIPPYPIVYSEQSTSTVLPGTRPYDIFSRTKRAANALGALLVSCLK